MEETMLPEQEESAVGGTPILQPSFEQTSAATVTTSVPVQFPNSEKKTRNVLWAMSLIFAIIGLILIVTLIGAPLGIILLVLALIFGLIGIFKKKRGKAIAGFFISGVSLGAMAFIGYQMYDIIYVPTKEFVLMRIKEVPSKWKKIPVDKVEQVENLIETAMTEAFSSDTWLKNEEFNGDLTTYITSKENLKKVITVGYATATEVLYTTIDEYAAQLEAEAEKEKTESEQELEEDSTDTEENEEEEIETESTELSENADSEE